MNASFVLHALMTSLKGTCGGIKPNPSHFTCQECRDGSTTHTKATRVGVHSSHVHTDPSVPRHETILLNISETTVLGHRAL